MSTTYAGVSESSATNYLFLFAQRTLALQNTPPTPPPLNVVGLPCEAICLLWEWLRLYNAPLQPVAEAKQLKKKKAEAEEAAEAEATQLKVTLAIEQAVAEIRERVYSEFEGSEELKAAEELKIAPLAEKITAYIIDGILTAQEKRWRTTMKRDTENNFRTQREAAAKVEKEMQRQRDAINEVHSKLDRLIARQDPR